MSCYRFRLYSTPKGKNGGFNTTVHRAVRKINREMHEKCLGLESGPQEAASKCQRHYP